MAIERVGTEVTINTSNPESSQSITVPTDAQIAIAFLSAWSDNSDAIIPNPTLTLGGTGLTRLTYTDNYSVYNMASLEYRVSPPTGSQTLAWNFTSWLAEGDAGGCLITIVFYKGIDTVNPFVDWDAAQNAGSLTGMTFDSGDMMVGGVASDGTGVDASASSQTLIHKSAVDAISSVFVLAVAEKLSTGTFDYTSESFPGAVACILAEGATYSLEQEGFRFRNDDADEDAATWKDTQDTNINSAVATKVRLRILLNATGDNPSKNFQLEYRRKPNGGSFGSWTKVE